VKREATSFKSFLLAVAFGFAALMFIVSGCLYQQNTGYKKANRKLIIENDSIMSANIELKHALQQKNAGKRTASVVYK
jgi:hypothetical protein